VTKVYLLFSLLIFSSGCMEHQLREKSMKLSKTTTDLLFIQVLDNIARTIDSPTEMPYFNMPASGTAQIQQQLSVIYTPQWAVSTAANSFAFGKMIFNQQSAAFNPQQIDQESWQLSPVADPDRLILMHCAYLRAVGQPTPDTEKILCEYYEARDAWVDITVEQTEHSRAIWVAWNKMSARAKKVLYCLEKLDWKIPNLPAPRPLPPAPNGCPNNGAEEQNVCESFIIKIWNSVPDTEKDNLKELLASPLPKYTKSVKLGFILQYDQEYQYLKAQYEILMPPNQQQKSDSETETSFWSLLGSLFKKKVGGAGASGGSGASGSGPPGGGASASGKPPLPIYVNYKSFLQPGWYNVGRKCDVPKEAVYVGHYGHRYVWVSRDQIEGLSKFTLAILDFYNIGNTGGSNIPTPPPATLGR
jgi:hypothetical protein